MRISQENEDLHREKNRESPPQKRTQASHSLTYSKKARLLFKSQYIRLAKEGTRFFGTVVAIDFRKGHSPIPKLGVTISKRFGKAVIRNRFKRVVREAFRLTLFPSSLEINVMPRLKSSHYSRHQIRADFDNFLKFFEQK